MLRRLPRSRPRTAPGTTPEAPYAYAAQVYAHFVSQAERHARGWRWGMTGMTGFALLCGICLVYQSTRPTVTPYVIEVDTLGAVRSVGPAEVPYVPTEAAVASQVRQFILATRGLPVDGVVLHERWTQALAICTPRGYQKLLAYAEARQVQKDLGKKTVAVSINRTLKASDTSWDVRWTELTTDEHGQKLAEEVWSGLFTMTLRQPTTEAEVAASPLGIWIDDFSWTKQ
jgi:type IV secretion system protein TrbF